MPKKDTDYQHEQHGAYSEKWRRAREVIAGEDAVKAAGERYLPKLTGMETTEYTAYKDRTKFLGATSRTLEGLTGMVFRVDPMVGKAKAGAKAQTIEQLEADATLQGETLVDYSKNLVREVLSVGRAGTLVDYSDQQKRPYFASYCPENIWNWQTNLVDGKHVLTMVLLHEQSEEPASAESLASAKADDLAELEQVSVERLRLIFLQDIGASKQCVVRVFEKVESKKNRIDWRLVEERIPLRKGRPLDFVPFVFHNSDNSKPGCCKLPLEDIISVNLHHYRLSADYNHGLHFTALPTAWVAGFPADSKLNIGASVAWVTDNVQAKAGFLEYTGQGLGAIREAIADDKKDMAILGARLLEEQKREAETSETLRIRQSGETSVLSSLAKACSRGISTAMKIAYWWGSTEVSPSDVPDEQASIVLNTDFVESRLAPEEQAALVSSWIAGAISHKTVLEQFRKGEILPSGRTDEEEVELIAAAPAPGSTGRTDDKDDDAA